ncbi:hypothetical protein ACA910_015388 [Epithemia clementina (nom. ined.)]
MLQKRHYLIGQVPLMVAQLQSSADASTNPNPNNNLMTVTLQSNIQVADANLFLCVAPDSKFPTLCGLGWSLAVHDPQVAYGSNGGAGGGS